MVSTLALPNTHSEKLLEFIRILLPTENNIPNSFYVINKMFTTNLVKEYKLCHICKKQLANNKCPSETCLSNSQNAHLNIRKSIKIVTADIKTQLNSIIKTNLDNINKYKSMLTIYNSNIKLKFYSKLF